MFYKFYLKILVWVIDVVDDLLLLHVIIQHHDEQLDCNFDQGFKGVLKHHVVVTMEKYLLFILKIIKEDDQRQVDL